MTEAAARLTPDDIVTLNRASTIARLLAGVAHDLNNALLVIGGTAELLDDAPLRPEAVSKGMARIRVQTVRAGAVISQLLDFARGSQAARGAVNLRDVAATAIALRTYAIGRAGVMVTYEPPAGRTFVVQGSRVLLLQALLNLIGNAEQALAGTPGGAIRIELNRADGHAVLRVADNGPGVPPDDRTRIFDPLHTTRSREEASGLGLAAARRIAERHGGMLTLEETAAGASFVLQLPVEPEQTPG